MTDTAPPAGNQSRASASHSASRGPVLLSLAVLGFLVPPAMLVAFSVQHGFDLALYFRDWFATLPSTQIFVDLSISFLAFMVWAGVDGRRTGVKRWWVTIPAALLVGLCFAIPLYLVLRERAQATHSH